MQNFFATSLTKLFLSATSLTKLFFRTNFKVCLKFFFNDSDVDFIFS